MQSAARVEFPPAWLGKADKTSRALDRLARKMEPALRDAFMAAVRSVKATTTVQAIYDALTSSSPGDAIRMATDALDLERMRQALAQIVDAAGMIGQAALEKELRPFGAKFDMVNPRAVDYIRHESAMLVREIKNDQRAAVRNIIERSFVEGIPPKTAAREIKSFIGLTEYQTNVVMNYQLRLLESGAADVEGKTIRYGEKLLRRRSITIARTESINASNAGLQASWEVGRDLGVIPREAYQVWIVAPDDRLCPICEAIPLMPENESVPIGGVFILPDGRRVKRPTAHPNCRCTIGLGFPKE